MKMLAIDSSSNIATVAIVEDSDLICEIVLNDKKTHSQKLMPLIKEALLSCKIGIDQIDVFSCSVGPGSFTGLRIGLATVKGLAHAFKKPIIGVSTLDALAFGIPFYSGIICPIMDARNNQVFTALYKWSNDSIERISEYMGIDILELADMIDNTSGNVVFTGDGINIYREILRKKLGGKAQFAPKYNSLARASLVAQIGINRYNMGIIDSYITLSPFYLRKSQAERLHTATK